MYNSFDIESASKSCSVKTVEFLTRSQKIAGKKMILLKRASLNNEALMLFTSLLVIRRRPEAGVHCILIYAMSITGDMKVEELNRLTNFFSAAEYSLL